MSEHFKFVAYWHSFVNLGNDPLDLGLKFFWASSPDVMQRSYDKMDAAFEFISKLGLDYFCFHDFDLVEEADSFNESERRLSKIVDYGKDKFL